MSLSFRALNPLGLILCALQLSACATITRTEHADWKVDTLPQGAALSASNGGRCDATPCILRVSRKEHFTATLTKDGYQPMTLEVKPALSPSGDLAFAGNILIGGLIGMGVDLYTGAALAPSPAGGPYRLTPIAYYNSANPPPDRLFMLAPKAEPMGKPAPPPADCPPEKVQYAAFLGVSCAALGAPAAAATPATRRR